MRRSKWLPFLHATKNIPTLTYDDDYRSYLNTRRTNRVTTASAGRKENAFRVQARTALRHVNGYFKTMIAAIAKSKLRRWRASLSFVYSLRPVQQ